MLRGLRLEKNQRSAIEYLLYESRDDRARLFGDISRDEYRGIYAGGAQFESVEAFIAAAKAFRPAKAPTDLTELFTMPELGQPDDPRTGKPVVAERLSSCDTLWMGQSQALVFATAAPKTDAAPSAVGVLFLLARVGPHWTIADLLRFTATGKHADVSAELTASVGTGYQLGSDGMPVITISESQGGRGYGYQLSASFGVALNRLKRLDLE